MVKEAPANQSIRPRCFTTRAAGTPCRSSVASVASSPTTEAMIAERPEKKSGRRHASWPAGGGPMGGMGGEIDF